MYIYKGQNPETETSFQKEFTEEADAIEYAIENTLDYPMFEVIDTEFDNEIIFSSIEIDESDELDN